MADRLRGDYSIQRRARRWYMSVYYWSIDTAIVNALILHRQYMEEKDLKARSTEHMYFRASLVEHLHMRAMQERAWAVQARAASASGVHPNLARSARVAVAASTGCDAHLPVFSHATQFPARMCCHCGTKKSPVMCSSSSCAPSAANSSVKHFCLTTDRNCFLEYHRALL